MVSTLTNMQMHLLSLALLIQKINIQLFVLHVGATQISCFVFKTADIRRATKYFGKSYDATVQSRVSIQWSFVGVKT